MRDWSGKIRLGLKWDLNARPRLAGLDILPEKEVAVQHSKGAPRAPFRIADPTCDASAAFFNFNRAAAMAPKLSQTQVARPSQAQLADKARELKLQVPEGAGFGGARCGGACDAWW